MVRVTPSLLVLAAAVAAASPAAAQGSRGNLGGGLIEFLVTGNSGAPRGYAQPAPVMVPAARPAAYAVPTGSLPMLPEDEDQQPVRPGPRQASLQAAPMPQVHGFDAKYERQTVTYTGPHRAGTVVIDTPNRFLYLVGENGTALRYGIGVGRPGFEWAGSKSITRKAEWPAWTPPPEMLKRRPDLPRFMEGGPDNPLGARALYLGSSLYRIHGTNEPSTIGQAVSSGCIRMRNEDVTDLYGRVRVGTRVVVI